VDNYHIERSDAGGPFIDIAIIAAPITSFADRGLIPGTLYSYRVRSSSGGTSPTTHRLPVCRPWASE